MRLQCAMKHFFFAACLLIPTTSFAADANPAARAIYQAGTIHQPELSRDGMVSTQESVAAQVGADILRRGGNAVDAAVAVGFALAVTHPQAGNLGGWRLHDAGSARR